MSVSWFLFFVLLCVRAIPENVFDAITRFPRVELIIIITFPKLEKQSKIHECNSFAVHDQKSTNATHVHPLTQLTCRTTPHHRASFKDQITVVVPSKMGSGTETSVCPLQTDILSST